MGKKIVMCDTGVVLKALRGDAQVLREIDEIGFANLAVSAVTVAELYYGMRKNEARTTKAFLGKMGLFHIDKATSVRFVDLLLAHRNRLQIPDALIAATALVQGVELYTFNTKDFEFIEGIRLYKPKSWHSVDLT
ncbi:PIN domain-containing protein [Rhodoflexus sp.]